jgi:hypothetical protein
MPGTDRPRNGHRDYSGVPLWRKLGIAPGARVYVRRSPEDLAAALTAIAPLPDGVRFLARPGRDLDVAVLFLTAAADLGRVETLRDATAVDGRLWIAWPKKSSGVPTDVTFEAVQRAGLAAGLVDNKTAAITPVFQGLQFVRRAKDRPRR